MIVLKLQALTAVVRVDISGFSILHNVSPPCFRILALFMFRSYLVQIYQRDIENVNLLCA